MIRASRTGMTRLGIALQGLAIMTAIVAMCLIIWPRLPLLTEWPAQWLALVEGLDKTVVKEAVKDGATGISVESKTVVFLSSSAEEGGELRLICARP
jgi:predicted benzoate:H+ symporter BenE